MRTGLSRGLRAISIISLLLVQAGCARLGLRRVQVKPVTIDANCKVSADYVLIWSDPPTSADATMVKWTFPAGVYGKITAAEAKAQDPYDLGYGHTKRKLLNLEYTTERGQTFLSGKPKKLKPKLKDNKYDPMWYYTVTIWENVDGNGEPEGNPKCGSDPGVCIRGGGGSACEAYRATP